MSRKFILPTMLVLAVETVATAQPPPEEATSAPNCAMEPLLPEGARWSGDCSGGAARGAGLVLLADGGIWEGQYVNGVAQGSWTLTQADGLLFTGSYVDGKQHGRWTSAYGEDTGGGVYADGVRHGRWKLLVAASDDEAVRGSAEGLYVNGQRQGLWTTKFASGTVHERRYEAGVLNGDARSEDASGTVAQGPYVAGERHGRWVFKSSDGSSEEGTYEAGEKHGDWREKRADGSLLSGGPYDEGEKHGRWSYFGDEGNDYWDYVDGEKNLPEVLLQDDACMGSSFTWAGGPYGSVGDGAEERVQQLPCWWKVERHSDYGCYVSLERDWLGEGMGLPWDLAALIVRWDGTCENGLAVGSGNLELLFLGRDEEGEDRRLSVPVSGSFDGGLRHGPWKLAWTLELADSANWRIEEEGHYANGRKHGEWVETRRTTRLGEWRYIEPEIVERRGPYADGQEHGQWTITRTYRAEPPFRTSPDVDGRKDDVYTGRVENGVPTGCWSWTHRDYRFDDGERGVWRTRSPEWRGKFNVNSDDWQRVRRREWTAPCEARP